MFLMVVIVGIDPTSSPYEGGAHPSTPYHLWSGIGESNSYENLGKVPGNLYINPAYAFRSILEPFEGPSIEPFLLYKN